MKEKSVPIKKDLPVELEGNRITAYFKFHESLLEKPEGSGMSYADLCCRGITFYWGKAGFDVKINRLAKGQNRPHVRVLPARVSATSYVMSPCRRWFWGLFRSGFHPEAFMLNWSPEHPGNIHLNIRTFRNENRFMRVCAHEFGHILGIGDAYGAHYRFFYEAPGTENFMMNSNREVSSVEAEMVRTAHKSGRMQYFPLRFSAKSFFAGLRRRIKRSRS